MEKLIKKPWVTEGILSEVWLQIHMMPHIWNSGRRMQNWFKKSSREVYLILWIQCFQRRNKFFRSWKAPFIQNSKWSICYWYKQRHKIDPQADFQETGGRREQRKKNRKRERELRQISSFVLNICQGKLGNDGFETKRKGNGLRKVLQGINGWWCPYKWRDSNLIGGGDEGMGTVGQGQTPGLKKKIWQMNEQKGKDE